MTTMDNMSSQTKFVFDLSNPDFVSQPETQDSQVDVQEVSLTTTQTLEVEVLDATDQAIEERLQEIDERLFELDSSIDNLTSHADKLDYTMAVASGVIAGIIDIFFVGKWDFASAKAWSNQEVNEQVIRFAQSHPKYEEFVARKRKYNPENRLSNAVEFLEGEFHLPGDSAWNFLNSTITAKTHHLDDLCHHPTIIGLVCCVIVQFTGTTIYSDKSSNFVKLPITVNDYGKFVGRNTIERMFAGVINWFINVAETLANRKGHLMSDMAGSINSVKNGKGGMGIPGAFMSTMKELASIPCFQKTDFAENLRKAYQNGIGSGKGQVNLGAFNALFEGVSGKSSKFDMRTEMAIGHELKRQSIPVIVNEILVRACYFVRRLIDELKAHDSVVDIELKRILPFGNRTIERMMTISTGTFFVVDTLDAVIEGAVYSKFNGVEFGRQVLLRLNFVGIGRFTIALGTETVMGIKKFKATGERRLLKNEILYHMQVKIYQGDVLIWEAAQDADASMDSLYDALRSVFPQISADMVATRESLQGIEQIDVLAVEEHNPDLMDELRKAWKKG